VYRSKEKLKIYLHTVRVRIRGMDIKNKKINLPNGRRAASAVM
jgi:hypothetical protein